MSLFYNIILALAGLGVLLYGVRLLNVSLESTLGVGFKRTLTSAASSKFKSYWLGAGVTTLTQSNTLTLSMVTGFVNVGTISLGEGLAIVLGANLGSALAIVILAFEAISIIKILSILCVISAFILLICKKNAVQKVATTMMGFGLLCLGLTLVGEQMQQIVMVPSIYAFVSTLTNPILLFLAGAFICFITDSTYATIAILMALVGTSTLAGPMDIQSAMIMFLGANFIGGLSTFAYTVSGTTPDSKRILSFHVLFKMLVSVIFTFIIMLPWVDPFYHFMGEQAGITIILIYIVMMIVPGLIMLPFTNTLANLMKKIIPKKNNTETIYDIFMPDENVIKIFGLAYAWAMKCIGQILRMETDLAEKMVMRISDKNFDEKGLQGKIKALDKIIKVMSNNVIRISANQSEANIDKMNILMGILNDANHLLERIEKIYNYGTIYKDKPRSMTVTEAESTFPQWIKLRELAELLIAFVANIKDMDENAKDKALKEIFEVGNRNSNDNVIARQELFKECKLKSSYADSSLYLNTLLAFENMNTDISNIAIRFGILER